MTRVPIPAPSGGGGVAPADLTAAIEALKGGAPEAYDTLIEIANLASAAQSQGNAAVANIANHTNGNGSKHDAVNIHVVEQGGINGTNTQDALQYATSRANLGANHAASGTTIPGGKHYAFEIEGQNSRWSGDDLQEILATAATDVGNVSGNADSALGLASNASNDVGALLPVALKRYVGRYEFSDQGGAEGVISLHAPGTTNPVLFRPVVTDRHFVATEVDFYIREPLVGVDGHSINFGFQSNVTALGNAASLPVEAFDLDGSQFGAGEIISSAIYAGRIARGRTQGDFDQLAMRINGGLTAGKVDVIVTGYELPRSLLV